MKTIGVYAGSFDPFTRGHLDILITAAKGFDSIIVAIGHNPDKKGLFSVEERRQMIGNVLNEQNVLSINQNISMDYFSGLLTTYCKELKESEGDTRISIIRGLRAVSDFEQEMAIAHANTRLSNGEFPTFFIPSNSKTAFVSSSGAKQLAFFTEARSVLESDYVTPSVADALVKRLLNV